MKITKDQKTHFGLKFIATGKETDGKYFLSSTTIPAGDPGPPVHSHQHEAEGFYLFSGELIFIVDGTEVSLSAGQFLNIERGEKHTWRNNSSEDAQVHVTFTPAGIEQMFVELEEDMSQIREIGLRYGTEFEV